MVFARILRNLIRDTELGPRIVPIIPDEARTFGLDPLFKEVGIYAALGQRYEPVDSELVLSYREASDGQVLEEGITEAGSMASFTAAATAYATQGLAMIPFYIFYSMFGFQRTGDQAWAVGDARGRGFMMGATAGRTTLHGEGLQHDDGHSHLLASTVPSVRAYDPAYAYELAAVVRDGIERMYVRGEDVYYYVTIYNENYPMPAACPRASATASSAGCTASPGPPDGVAGKGGRVRLVGSGSILQQVVEAQAILGDRFDVAAEVYSAPSFQQLRRDAIDVDRWNRLHPGCRSPGCRTSRRSWATTAGRSIDRLGLAEGGPGSRPAVAARPTRSSLGTEGFGRSDTRENLRALFEIDAANIAAAALSGLARAGAMPPKRAAKGIARPRDRPGQDRPARPLSRGDRQTDETHDRRERHRPGRDRPRRRRRPARASASPASPWPRPGPRRPRSGTSILAALTALGDRAIRHPDRVAGRPARVRLQGRGPAAPRAIGQPPVRRHRARPREARPGRRRRSGGRRDDPRRGGIPDGRSGGGLPRPPGGRVPRRQEPGRGTGRRGRGRPSGS